MKVVSSWAFVPLNIGSRVQCIGRSYLGSTRMASSCSWQNYLVEFRGSAPSFRFAELNDAALSTLGPTWTDTNAIDYTAVVSDTQSTSPICVYVKLPDDNTAKTIATRCSLVRRILQVWGDGATPQDALLDAQKHMEMRVDPVVSTGTGKGTWRMQFERFGREGRSGMSEQERKDLLTLLSPIGLKFNGKVDLKSPEHHLVYLEDWHTYHAELHALIADIKNRRRLGNADNHDATILDTPDVVAARELNYKPLRCIIGRVVGEGPCVVTKYDLRNRPFIGTTSMNALSSHLSANAARVKVGQKVLDPFCGTGSLLVAAASLGADVVGSDIDAAGLLGNQLVTCSADVSPGSALYEVVLSSKNARFTRKGGKDQAGLCVMDNFKFYHLQDRVADMVGVSVDKWLLIQQDKSDREEVAFTSEWERNEYGKISKHDKFDAIVTDPPFGKRERAENFAENSSGCSSDSTIPSTSAHSPSVIPASLLPSLGSVECLGDPSAVLVTLFRVALQRLKLGGMLVFWLPTRAFTTAEEVREYVGNIQDTARPLNAGNDAGNASSMDGDTISHNSSRKDSRGVLQLERVTAEELNDNLWRWLCVLQLT